MYNGLTERARAIRMVITDCDGVLTDNGVYYGAEGEILKRFSIRDGMGVERLRTLAGIATGIVTGEQSPSIRRRVEKLGIEECHLGILDKAAVLQSIACRRTLPLAAIAYIGDDINDLGAMSLAGLCACPTDALPEVKNRSDFICTQAGGHGAFREFAEFILAAHIKS